MSRLCPSCGESQLPERSLYCLGCGASLSGVESDALSEPYTPAHLEQMKLAWLCLHTDSWWHGKRLLADLVRGAAAGNLGTALEMAYQYLAAVRAEIVDLSGFSVHADADELIAWLASCPEEPDDPRRPGDPPGPVQRAGKGHIRQRKSPESGLSSETWR